MSPSLVPLSSVHSCPYCGQEIRGVLYFCPACSTPWRPPDIRLGPAPEPDWDDETLIRKKAPEVYQLFFYYLGAVLFSAIVTAVASQSEDSVALFVVSGIAVIGVTLYGSFKHWDVLKPVLTKPGLHRPAFFVGLLLGVLLLGVNFLWNGVLREWLEQDAGKSALRHLEALGSGTPLTTAFLLVCVLPAITEEIGFRGVMQSLLLRAVTPRKAIIVSSLLFSAAHFSLFSFPYLFLVGVLLGWLLQKTGSIYPGMVIHCAHNFAVIWFINSNPLK
jgi:membrane protease YdiL (CAAX protease family)